MWLYQFERHPSFLRDHVILWFYASALWHKKPSTLARSTIKLSRMIGDDLPTAVDFSQVDSENAGRDDIIA